MQATADQPKAAETKPGSKPKPEAKPKPDPKDFPCRKWRKGWDRLRKD